jgi:tRNA uridine 5-carbamoylmethylation protein Kti12
MAGIGGAPTDRDIGTVTLGFPGVGKLTIARDLGRRLPARVIDNHWVNNPVLALLDEDGYGKLPEAVWEQTARVRQAILETIATLCDPAANFVFTNAGTHGDARSIASYHR